MASVLVIDAEPVIRRLIRELLERQGFNVREAANGVEGLQAFASHGPDLVISDVFMPVRDGLEVFRDLRRRSPGVKIIAMSGGSDGGNLSPEQFLQMSEQMGATATLVKPFTAEELLAAVRTALTRLC